MKAIKQLGIGMDHHHALCIEMVPMTVGMNNKTVVSRNVVSEWNDKQSHHTHPSKIDLFNSPEKKHLQAAYFHELSEIIRNYDHVVLFGPTDAKNELHNILKSNHLFQNIQIELVDTDKMNESDMEDYVLQYFS
jgi:hypothetical protein